MIAKRKRKDQTGADRLDTEICFLEKEREREKKNRSHEERRVGARSQRPVNLEETTRSDRLGRSPPSNCGHRPIDRDASF